MLRQASYALQSLQRSVSADGRDLARWLRSDSLAAQHLRRNRRHVDEIDSLRAIAVLAVVVFHAFPQLMPGGFIGVDVFFVVSGYVIARSYLASLLSGERTLVQFYSARFRRLAPALILMLLGTAIAAATLLEPEQLISFSRSLLLQPLYAQNFYFWADGDYFSESLTKPLLHTWSLAVEEQFYVLWGLAILLTRRRPVVTAILLGSGLMLSVVLGSLLSARSPSTVFYLLPTRIWEFGIGIVAYLATLRVRQISRPVTAFSTYGAALAILLAAADFDGSSRFPGAQSFGACLATGVALLCFEVGDKPPRTFRLMPLLYIGRVSYGFYLWHWPPIVFYFTSQHAAPSWPGALALVVASFLIACVCYHAIENPIRYRKRLALSRTFYGALGWSTTAIVGLAGVGLMTSGLLDRYPERVRPLFAATQERGGDRCGRLFVLLNPEREFCPLGDIETGSGAHLVVGDSHADVTKEVVALVGNEVGVATYLAVRSCDLGEYGTRRYCADSVLSRLLEHATDTGITDVIAISYWAGKTDFAAVERDAERFTSAGIRVHLMVTVPNDPDYHPAEKARVALEGGQPVLHGIARDQYEAQTRTMRTEFRRIQSRLSEHLTILDPIKSLCPAEYCKWQSNGQPFYRDTNHLTLHGALQLASMFSRYFADTIRLPSPVSAISEQPRRRPRRQLGKWWAHGSGQLAFNAGDSQARGLTTW